MEAKLTRHGGGVGTTEWYHIAAGSSQTWSRDHSNQSFTVKIDSKTYHKNQTAPGTYNFEKYGNNGYAFA